MRVGGVVRTRREGRLVYCSLDRETIKRRQLELGELLGIGFGPPSKLSNEVTT
jgi:DNA-binding transcriptional ArsR family regulator